MHGPAGAQGRGQVEPGTAHTAAQETGSQVECTIQAAETGGNLLWSSVAHPDVLSVSSIGWQGGEVVFARSTLSRPNYAGVQGAFEQVNCVYDSLLTSQNVGRVAVCDPTCVMFAVLLLVL